MNQTSDRRKVYLEDIPLDEALERLLNALGKAGGLDPLPGEEVPVEDSVGRVTAQPLWAKISSPHYHAAAMDGAAVRAEETLGASETSPLRLKLGEQAIWIDTGDPLPPECNAVIMIEHVQRVEENLIEIMSPVAPWQHVRPMGEDIIATDLVLTENHLVRPVDLGAIAACGLNRLQMRQQPRVCIIPTGSELVLPGEPLKSGSIIEFNSMMLAEMVKEWGGIATRHSPVPDDYGQLKTALEQALSQHDIVIINAGSSAGREDFTAPVIADLGEVLVHGIAIRPGHPVVLGIVKGKAVLGIPGYPAAAVLTIELLAKPLIYRLLGLASQQRSRIEAVMSRKVLSSMGQDEFLRVKLGKVGDRLVATPLQRGAGVTMSLVRADGLVCIPRFSEGIQVGVKVSVELMRSREEIENTIVAIGSHDLALDVLANHLRRQYPERTLSSSNVGSIGGLLALKQYEAHLAGSHLLDEETGEYNISYVKKLLPDIEVIIVNLVFREQGLIVAKGNPKGINGLADLLRPDVNFVNRQRGAGTRVLLDYKLHQTGLDPQNIRGYERTEFTHLAVAAAVDSGTADVGLGIVAAARALDLDFVPLLKEQYDLVIPKAHYENPFLEPMLSILNRPSFQRDVEALGGYDVSQMGRVMWPTQD
jgi:putative molybdopterin biosynthesis protein